MNRHQLYLIRPNFLDQGKGPFFCPGCAQMIGLLDYYPALKQDLEVCVVDFQRPRLALVELLGEEYQSCPVLILRTAPRSLPSNVNMRQANGRYFVEGADEIAAYLAQACSSGLPH